MQAPTDTFDVERAIREILSDGKEQPCIFDRLLQRFEAYSSRPAGSIYEIKRRDNKKSKGDAWERFCHFYLTRVMQYHRVWLWKDIPNEVRQHLRLGSRVDNGIDLVAQENPNSGFIAVQCKYRQRIDRTVTWTTLSTFIGLCAQTGPWLQHLVMTNCKGVSRKTGIQRGPKDRTIAYGTFKNLTRFQCLQNQVEVPTDFHRVAEGVATVTMPKTQEELRALRLAKFNQ